MPPLSPADGFLRLPLDEVLSLDLHHLMSGVDADAPVADDAGHDRCGRAASISGFTEWASSGAPGVSIGWDWRLDAAQVSFVRVGLPRSNLLLVDDLGHDYAWDRNLEVLATVVDAMPWSRRTQRAVTTRMS